jgi:hypothetical protein
MKLYENEVGNLKHSIQHALWPLTSSQDYRGHKYVKAFGEKKDDR